MMPKHDGAMRGWHAGGAKTGKVNLFKEKDL